MFADIDHAAHADLRADLPADVLADLFGMFRLAVATEWAAVGEGLRTEDMRMANRAAHRLAGAAAQYGFPALAAAARSVEAETARGRLPAAVLLAQVAAALQVAESFDGI